MTKQNMRAKWIAAVEASSMPDEQKEMARNIHRSYRRWKTIVPWELDGFPSYCDLNKLCYYGFLYLVPGQGCYVPIIEPLPAPGSIKTTPPMDKIIRHLLAGRDLYHVNRQGYITRADETIKWVLRESNDCGRMKIDEDAATKLAKMGLIEPDGCGHGWPYQYTSRVRLNMRMLLGVAAFAKVAQKWLNEHRPKKEAVPAA